MSPIRPKDENLGRSRRSSAVSKLIGLGRALPMALMLILMVVQCALADTQGYWRRQEQATHGRFSAMIEALRQADNLPTPRALRPQSDLVNALQRAGRFRELGLTDEEGGRLVAALYARLEQGRPASPATAPGLREAGSIPYPPAGYHAGQEFAPLDAVLLRWPFDWPAQQESWGRMVEAFNLAGTPQTIYVDTEKDRDNAMAYLSGKGIATHLITWKIQPTNSVWIRDYGPQFVYAGDVPDWAIADFHYYGGRPLDDSVPLTLARTEGVPRINRQSLRRVFTEGGNLNHDGMGCVIYSQRTYLENNLPEKVVDERIRSAFNATKSIVPEEPSLDATGHVDMFMKIVSPTRVLVAQYEPNQKDYQILEDCAQLMQASTNGTGQPWEVIRIPQPDVYYIGFVMPVVRTYTNSLLANSVVILPVYDIDLDAEAIAIYQEVFPDRTIVPIDASSIIEAAGAWHCVTMEFPSPSSRGVVE